MTYTCPMHPEVVSDKPGRCPKCGMSLVLRGSTPQLGDQKRLGPLTWRSYVPLMAIITGMVIVTAIVSISDARTGMFSWSVTIGIFMTLFFLVFSVFKLIDLKGFAHGYATYDLLAQRLPAYGYIYPFIELFFGISMGALFFGVSLVPTPVLLWLEVAVMLFSGIGVAIKLAKHEEFQCVCLGTFLKVPLTKVTLVEDFGMAALAVILLFMK